MKPHPYLRAYMAGVLLPSWFLLLAVTAFLIALVNDRIPPRLTSAMVFPMAIVPNLWGAWNALYHLPALRRRIPIGVFGALLPLILVPAGLTLAAELNLGFFTPRQATIILPVAMIVYYLVWKYAVAYFNRIVDLR